MTEKKQKILKCNKCKTEANISEQLFDTFFTEVINMRDRGLFLCGNCYKTAREAEKEHIADKLELGEEKHNEQQEYYSKRE